MSAGERIVLEGCAVATVDGDGTEHADGHVVVEGGRIAAVGPGAAPAADGPQRRVDASGCLATPGLVNCHHHLYQWATRGLAQEATLFEWLQALYPIWAQRRRGGRARRRARRARRPPALGLLALDRPPLRLPPRRGGPARDRDRGRARPRRALPPLPRIDGPGPLVRRPAARRGGRGPRRDPGRLGGGDRPLPRHELRRHGADRARAVLAVLGHGRADGGDRGARPPARRAAAHPPGGDDRRGGVLPRALRRAARSSTSSSSAGSATTCGSPTASTSTSARSRASARRAPASPTARAPTPGSARASRRCPACWPRARRSGSASTAPPPTRRASCGSRCARRS